MKKQLCLFIVLVYSINSGLSQFYDNHWINGNDDDGDGIIAGNLFTFQDTLPIINGITLNYELGVYNTTMSDAEGNLIFYSNGVKIINAQHELMENGDSLNWGDYTENHLDNYNNVNLLNIALPMPEHDSLYYIIHSRANYGPPNGILADRWLYTIIDMSKNGGLGKVTAKDQLIGTGHTIIDVNACRHANGRDWWIIAQEDSASLYYRCLLTPEGITGYDTQYIGQKPPWPSEVDFGGQNIFSPNGKRYIDFDARNGIRVFDFDRCTGLLNNFRYVNQPTIIGKTIGAAISPNSKFLYISTNFEILQFSLNAPDILASMDTVAVLDEYISSFSQQPLYFYSMQLMPDGKIYIVPVHGDAYLHYIANPDEKGDDCNVIQHGVHIPNPVYYGSPTFPNYRLYDLPGSPCDTLGINDPTPVVEQEREWPAEELVLSPNPAGEMLFLNTVAATSQPVEVIVSDLSGREVLRRAHPATVRSYGLRLPALAAGMYVVSVRLRDGRVLGERVVIGK